MALELVRRLEPEGSEPIEIYHEVPFANVEGRARAYFNHGRWVAGCPRQDCNHAVDLAPQQSGFECANCRAVAPVEWPSDADLITEVLNLRPVPQTRNWFPAGHELAIAFRVSDGQTVQDLIDENAEHGIY